MAEYVEVLDLDNSDGDALLVAAWDDGGSVQLAIVSKETTTFPDDDGVGNLGRPRLQTGTSAIYLTADEARKVSVALLEAATYKSGSRDE